MMPRRTRSTRKDPHFPDTTHFLLDALEILIGTGEPVIIETAFARPGARLRLSGIGQFIKAIDGRFDNRGHDILLSAGGRKRRKPGARAGLSQSVNDGLDRRQPEASPYRRAMASSSHPAVETV